MPRWLKVSGIIVIIVILLAAILQLATGARHGPGLHSQSGAGSVSDSTEVVVPAARASAALRHLVAVRG